MNNANGGWPFAVGSDRFVEEDFDVAEVAGNIFSQTEKILQFTPFIGTKMKSKVKNEV